jgi:flagellar hook-associated protein 1 FlgK
MSLLGIGTSALLTSQGNLATTSHNISNVNTEGYTRQRVDQSTRIPNFSGDQYFGTGVQISSVGRIYDNFLASQVRTYTSQEAQQNTYMTYSQQVDDLLGASDLSISSGLSAFFNAANEVADDPTSIAARQLMLTQGDLLANRFNTMDTRLTQLDSQIDYDLTVSVDEINNISKGIADLNQAITEARGQGAEPNDLLDQRDRLITELSGLVSVTAIEQSNGSVNILVGNGQALVAGVSNVRLSTITDNSTSPPRLGVGFGNNQINITAQLTGGKVGGALEFRRNTVDDTRAELDLLAQSVVEGINAVHNNATNIADGGQGSVDLDGNDGVDFFNPANITAASISMAISDPRQIAASSKFDAATGTVNISGPGNNENALALANLEQDKTLVQVSPGVTRSLSEQYSVLVSDVATRTRQAEVSQETQLALLQQTKQRFDAVGGVNLDEEAAQLIKYQQSYQAASQIIVVSNTIFQSLINAV